MNDTQQELREQAINIAATYFMATSNDMVSLTDDIVKLITANRTALLDAVEGVLPENKTLVTDLDEDSLSVDDEDGQRFCVECGQYEFEGMLNCPCTGYNAALSDVRTALATLRRQNCGLDGSSEPAKAASNQVDDRREFMEEQA